MAHQINPKVTVIVPAYNAENTIAACLDSLLTQTYPTKEIIVVNDGSKDQTPAICDSYADQYSGIKVIHKPNGGVSSARNAALDVAAGEYVAFVDSDDTVTPFYLEELMAWSDYDFVTAGYEYQAPDLIWQVREFEDAEIDLDELKRHPSQYMGRYYFGSPWATLTKRTIIESHQIRFNESIHSGEDTLFLFQYLDHVKTIKILPCCGYRYRFYPNSLVHTKHPSFLDWKIVVESCIQQFFEVRESSEKEVLLCRSFDVMRDLIRDYSNQMDNRELFRNIYKNPFFADALAYKRECGCLDDRLLILSMELKNYRIYQLYRKMWSLWLWAKGKIKRILSGM